MLIVFIVAGAASVAVMWYTIVWLKLISYISVNRWNRLGLSKTAEKNGTLSNELTGLHELCTSFWRIMHRKSRIMCELCELHNIFKRKILMFQYLLSLQIFFGFTFDTKLSSFKAKTQE